MTKLILGVLIWAVSHNLKRIAPGLRAALGNAGKGLVAVLSILAIWLMVKGYGAADPTVLWDLGAVGKGVNNLLMIGAVALVGAAHSKSRLREWVRHPMLWGAVLWSVAHLIANGDLRSLVLFGGLGLWALGSMALINRAEPEYVPFQGGTRQGDIRLAAITVVVYGAIAGLHIWLGVNPFGA